MKAKSRPMNQSPVSTTQAADANEIDLFSLACTLVGHKWLYGVLACPVYQVNTLVQMEPKKNEVLGIEVGRMLGQESPQITEIKLLNSRSIIGKAVDNLKLYIQVELKCFLFVGDFIARRFSNANLGVIANPWFGLNSYAWAGETVLITRIEVPDTLLGTELTLVTGQDGHFSLLHDDKVLVEGVAVHLPESKC